MYIRKSGGYVLFMAVLLLPFSAFSQNTIEEKRKELVTAEANLKASQARVDSIKAQIKALMPVVYWDLGGFQAVNFNQVSLTNWSKGGQNSFSVTALGNLHANYKKEKISWGNNLDLAYGLLKNVNEDFKKNEDKIDFTSRLGLRATKRLNWAASVRFESQFAPGYDDAAPDTNRPVISRFLAPAYIKASLGMDYQPAKGVSVYFSPAAGKFTIVNDDSIATKNLYIPESAENNKLRGEFGALFSASYTNPNLFENIGLRTVLELFNNYTDPNKPNRRNVDIDWQTALDVKLGKYIGANLFTHLIYDNDTKAIEYNESNMPVERGARIQFKEVLGVGFSYKF